MAVMLTHSVPDAESLPKAHSIAPSGSQRRSNQLLLWLLTLLEARGRIISGRAPTASEPVASMLTWPKRAGKHG